MGQNGEGNSYLEMLCGSDGTMGSPDLKKLTRGGEEYERERERERERGREKKYEGVENL